jgi:hypothetical protein
MPASRGALVGHNLTGVLRLLMLDQFHGERGAMFFHARSMLEGARDGRLPISEARQTFWFFAEDNKLLAESAAGA